MTPKIEWCNWVFDYMDTNKWIVKRDCCDDEILLILAGGNEIPSNHYGVLRDA